MFQSNIFDGFGSAELRFIIRNEWGVELGAYRKDDISPQPYVWFAANVTLPRGTTVQVREIDAFSSDDFGSAPISVPGIASGYTVNCWMHYTDNGWDGMYAGTRCGGMDTRLPIWAAEFKAS